MTFREFVLMGCSALLVSGCGWLMDGAKDTVNAGGKAAGEVAGEFFEGVSDGVENVTVPSIELHEDLERAGVSLGKVLVESAGGSKQNKMEIYFIFEKDISEDIRLMAFNSEGEEVGRTTIHIEDKAGHAGYYSADFDLKTHIESSSTVRIRSLN